MTDKKKNQRKKFLWFFCLLRGRIEKGVIRTKKRKIFTNFRRGKYFSGLQKKICKNLFLFEGFDVIMVML